MDDKISKIFDVVAIAHPPLAEVKVLPTKVQDDADFARANLRSLIETARTALENALQVAIQSESPRAYEVLATFINASADLNTKLIDVHQREQRIAPITPEENAKTVNTQNVTNNVVFTGTANELNELIMKGLKNEAK